VDGIRAWQKASVNIIHGAVYMEAPKTDPVLLHREEVLGPLFNLIKGSECGYIIRGPSMGKRRLIDFMMRADVQEHYLGERSQSIIFVPFDGYLVRKWSDLGLYELMLHTLMIQCGTKPELNKLQDELAALDTQVILQQSELLAVRHLQYAVHKICQTHQICFLLDGFDAAYQQISSDAFSCLRGIRDQNKYSVLFVLFLRQMPSQLRSPNDNEDFYELIYRSMISLGPYSRRDTLWIIQRMEIRRGLSLIPEEREWLYRMSGGHIGLIQTILGNLGEKEILSDQQVNPEEMLSHPGIYEQCNNIWEALSPEEQLALTQFEKTSQIESSTLEKLLKAKGLLKTTDDKQELFSPLFHTFLKNAPAPKETRDSFKRSLKVFLCHSSQDKSFIRKLYQKLCAIEGLDPWLDENKLLPGDDWNYEIRKAIEETNVVIVCISRNSITKEGYVQKEIKHVLDVADEKPEGTIFVIPVKVEECEIPRRLSQWHCLSYVDDGAFERLLLSLKKRAQNLGMDIMQKPGSENRLPQ
jgi:hypothetical protein